MMEQYETPNIEVVHFQYEDVITTSGIDGYTEPKPELPWVPID